MSRSRPPAPPVHPGEVLKAEFLDEIGVSAYALAKALCVPANRVTAIINGRTRHHCGDCAALSAIFRYDGFFLDEPAVELRGPPLRDSETRPVSKQEVVRYTPPQVARKEGAPKPSG